MASHEESLKRANKEIILKKDKINKMASRLNYHFMPQVGWMNDPNGFIKYNDEYHLFYQYYPFDSQWGPMHWGHAKSKDLFHWEYLPVALAPSELYDFDPSVEGYGCFSGSATIDEKNNLVLMYTGDVDGATPPQTQNIAISKNGIDFKKFEGNPVINNYPKEGSSDFRDPQVFKLNNKWYAVIGTHNDNLGELALYKSNDLKNWQYCGILVQSDGEQGTMWECPNLVFIDGYSYIIVSPMEGKVNKKPIVIKGNVDLENVKFESQSTKVLDYGADFYAPQLLQGENGRNVIIGWMNQWFSKMPTQKDGWAGAMTIPRELYLKDGNLLQKPVSEVKSLRSNSIVSIKDEVVSSVNKLNYKTAEASEIELEMEVPATFKDQIFFDIDTINNTNEKTRIIFDFKEGKIIFDRSKSGNGELTNTEAPLVQLNGNLKLSIFLDTNSVEMFVNDGYITMTNRIYPSSKNKNIEISTSNNQEARILNLNTWELKRSI